MSGVSSIQFYFGFLEFFLTLQSPSVISTYHIVWVQVNNIILALMVDLARPCWLHWIIWSVNRSVCVCACVRACMRACDLVNCRTLEAARPN